MLPDFITEAAPIVGYMAMGFFSMWAAMTAIDWVQDTLSKKRFNRDLNLNINLLRSKAEDMNMPGVVEVCDYLQRKGNWSEAKGYFGPTSLIIHLKTMDNNDNIRVGGK